MKGTDSDAAKSIFFMAFPPNLTIYVIISHFFPEEKPYLFLYSRRIVSAIKAMNSEFVGFPFPLLTV